MSKKSNTNIVRGSILLVSTTLALSMLSSTQFATQAYAQTPNNRPAPATPASSQPTSGSPAQPTAPSASAVAAPAAPPSATPVQAAGETPANAAKSRKHTGQLISTKPMVHHRARGTTSPNQVFSVDISVDNIDQIARMILVYNSAGGDGPKEVLFERNPSGGFSAEIPSVDVKAPGLAYLIEIESRDGERIAAFATRSKMHVVHIPEDSTDERERKLLEKLGGRRNVLHTSFEFVYFGGTPADVLDKSATTTAGTSQFVKKNIHDQYYRVEAGYTHRFLRDVAEFGIKAGVVRGQSRVPNETDEDKFNVGLNYGAPSLRLRALDSLHFEGLFLTSVTEVGFSVGGGLSVMIGDPYGEKMTIGFESIQVFGSRLYSRLDLPINQRWMVSPMIEITDMPHAADAGVRLLTEVGFNVGQGWHAAARGGYQARAFNSGGPSAGVSLSYAF